MEDRPCYIWLYNKLSHRETALLYMDKIEDVLLSYLPVVLFPVALFAMLVQRCKGKKKQE